MQTDIKKYLTYNVLILSWCDLNDISLTIREHEFQIIDLFILNIMMSLHLLSLIALARQYQRQWKHREGKVQYSGTVRHGFRL